MKFYESTKEGFSHTAYEFHMDQKLYWCKLKEQTVFGRLSVHLAVNKVMSYMM